MLFSPLAKLNTPMRACIAIIVLLSFALGHAEEKPLPAFKIVTYNVFATPRRTDERIPPLFKLLRESQADVIALQEAAPWFMELLQKEDWLKAYSMKSTDGAASLHQGLLILSRHPIQKLATRALPGELRRAFMIAEIKVGDAVITVANSHLESFPKDGAVRAEQLDLIFARLKDSAHAVFVADFNFAQGAEPETAHLDKSFKDAWLELQPKDPGFTWNMEASDMARDGSFPEDKSSRIDRVLFKSRRLVPKQIKIIGDSPVHAGKKDLFPSDHFGLEATFSINPDEE
jgi:endonuclease/exonuclease/phosphatase family metal-dependent hydrolase